MLVANNAVGRDRWSQRYLPSGIPGHQSRCVLGSTDSLPNFQPLICPVSFPFFLSRFLSPHLYLIVQLPFFWACQMVFSWLRTLLQARHILPCWVCFGHSVPSFLSVLRLILQMLIHQPPNYQPHLQISHTQCPFLFLCSSLPDWMRTSRLTVFFL